MTRPVDIAVVLGCVFAFGFLAGLDVGQQRLTKNAQLKVAENISSSASVRSSARHQATEAGSLSTPTAGSQAATRSEGAAYLFKVMR